jgi:hypothetical protein
MPFCYYRASQLRRQGQRELLIHKQRAAGDPYDFGRFELALEPWDAATPAPAPRPRARLPILGA